MPFSAHKTFHKFKFLGEPIGEAIKGRSLGKAVWALMDKDGKLVMRASDGPIVKEGEVRVIVGIDKVMLKKNCETRRREVDASTAY
jgi:hypothetical protein